MDRGSYIFIMLLFSLKIFKVCWNFFCKEEFDMSLFVVFGKNDIVEEYIILNEMVWSVMEDLFDILKWLENEVKSGYLYLFRVFGNEGFVKIGFMM